MGKKQWHFFFFILPIVGLLTGSAQDSNKNQNKPLLNGLYSNTQEIYQDSLISQQEYVIFHIANEYVGNDNVFFKGYLVSGSKKNRLSLSDVLIVELIDLNGLIVKRQFHKIMNGMVDGNLKHPENIKSGKYYLRAYTRWMKNYGEEVYVKKPIWFGDLPNQPSNNVNNSSVYIFPEGGHLLNGYENKVVMKIPSDLVNKGGVIGQILDNQNDTVAKVINYLGTGTALFKPRKGRKYRLVFENGYIYPIPNAQDEGYLMQVNNLDQKKIRIRINVSSKVPETNTKLVGIFKGKKYFEKELTFTDKNVLDIELSKKDFPKGIVILKLIDQEGIEHAVRPILIDMERLNLDISPISSSTEGDSFKIKVTDKDNSPVVAQLALSITKSNQNNKFVYEDYPTESSYLFTYPELAGNDIKMTDRNKSFYKDLIVLTSKQPLDSVSFKNDKKFSIQKGLELAGFAYDLGGKLLSNTKIQVIAQSEDGIWFKESETNVNGLLVLRDIQINGKSKLIFRTKGTDTKSRLVKIRPINQEITTGNISSNKAKKKEKRNLIYEPTFWKTKKEIDNIGQSATWEPVDTTGLIELDEVQITKKIQKVKKGRPPVYGISASKNRIKYQDSKKPKSYSQLLSGIPGITTSGTGESASFTINRANGPVLWVIDGFPLAKDIGQGEQQLGSASLNSVETLLRLGITATEIERIEILIGAEAAIYGTRGAGGVVLVYTRTGNELDYAARNEGQLILNGYENNLQFDTYQQNFTKKEKENSNLLYWNPKLETDRNGEVVIRFPSKHSLIKIQVSIITSEGKVGSLNGVF